MADTDFRWQAFFHRSADPLFLLNRQGHVLFVNRAWEQLTGIAAAQARRLWGRRPEQVGLERNWRDVLIHVLTPPAEVFDGDVGRHRRLVPAHDAKPPAWWDVDFFPIRDGKGLLGILGRIVPAGAIPRSAGPPLPESALAARVKVVQRLGGLFLGSKLPEIRRVEEQVRLASQVHSPVLLVGPAGSGKTQLARRIHFRGPTREQSFAAVDCRRLPPFAVAALLFGEVGAASRAPLATIYLKEPSYLPRDLQARLLTWIQADAGTDAAHPPRLIAGISDDPSADVAQGRLLEDFYNALATLRIDVPPLVRRRDDLPHLVDRCLQRLGRGKTPAPRLLTADAWEIVLAYSWPGNLRELYTVLQSASHRSAADPIDATHLPLYLRQAVRLGPELATPTERPLALDSLLERVERRLIELALRRHKGNQTRAAEMLAIWRPRLIRRLRALGLADAAPETEEPST